MARKNSLERPKPKKKPREEPGYVGWPVLFWLCRVFYLFCMREKCLKNTKVFCINATPGFLPKQRLGAALRLFQLKIDPLKEMIIRYCKNYTLVISNPDGRGQRRVKCS